MNDRDAGQWFGVTGWWSAVSLSRRVLEAYRWGGATHVLRSAVRLGVRRFDLLSTLSLLPISVLNRDDLRTACSDGDSLWYLPDCESLSKPADPATAIPLGYTEHDGRFLKTKYFTYPRNFVCELPGIRLLGPDGVAVTDDGAVIKTTASTAGNDSHERGIRRSLVTHPRVAAPTLLSGRRPPLPEQHRIPLACSLFRGVETGYYTWTLAELPKLRGVEHYRSVTGRDPKLVLPPTPPSYVTESLELLGYGPEDWRAWQTPAMDVDKLVIPSHPEPDPTTLRWLRSRMRDGVAGSDTTARFDTQYVYLSRARTGRRAVANEAAVTETLSALGFERYFAEELSFPEQVALCTTADVIVAPHGAALCNIVWADDASVIELFNDFVTDPFYIVASNLDHDYTALQGDSTRPTDRHSDFEVDIEELERAIRASAHYSGQH